MRVKVAEEALIKKATVIAQVKDDGLDLNFAIEMELEISATFQSYF